MRLSLSLLSLLLLNGCFLDMPPAVYVDVPIPLEDAFGDDVALADGTSDAEPIASFAFADRNPGSPWFEQVTGPETMSGAVWLLYFPSPG